MRLHTIQSDETLRSIAVQYAVDLQTLSDTNGITRHTRLTPGDRLLIPPRKCCCESLPPLILAGDVRPGYSGTAPYFNAADLSLLFCRGGQISHDGKLQLSRREKVKSGCIPAILIPNDLSYETCASQMISALCENGYSGVCLHAERYTDRELYSLSNAMHCADLFLSLSFTGESLLCHPDICGKKIADTDLSLFTPPHDMALEPFLSALTSIYPPQIRRHMLLSLSPRDGALVKKKTDARLGRRKQNNAGGIRCTDDCIEGICRLVHDGYAGVSTPVGVTAPFTYHLILSMGQVIPAAQRIGAHSRA